MTRALLLLAVLAGAVVAAQPAAARPPAAPRIAAVETTTLEQADQSRSIAVDVVVRSGPRATGKLSAALLDNGRWRGLGTRTYALPVGRGKLARRHVAIPLTAPGLTRLDARDTVTVRILSWRTQSPRQVAKRTVALARTAVPRLQTTIDDHGATDADAAAAGGMDEIFGHLAPDNEARLAGTTVVLDIIPASLKLTDLPAYAYLSGQKTFDGRPYSELRGVGGMRTGSTIRFAVGEELLTTVVGHPAAYGQGFMLAHEAGHIVNDFGLAPGQLAAANTAFADHTAAGGPWLDPGWYTASNEDEYFAQSVAAWFGHPYSPYTSEGYSRTWVQANDPAMAALLGHIFG